MAAASERAAAKAKAIESEKWRIQYRTSMEGSVYTPPASASGRHDNGDALARCRARFQSIRRRRRLQGDAGSSSLVRLHAYTINALQWWHIGISIYGTEWSFDGYQNAITEIWQQEEDSLKGVQSSTLEPHEAMTWFMGGKPEYREHELGTSHKSLDEVEAILEHLILHEYHAGWKVPEKGYSLVKRQCQDFAQHLLCFLIEPSIHAALVPADLLQTRDTARNLLHPSHCDRPTVVRNDTGRPLLLDIIGPPLVGWRPQAPDPSGILLADGASWSQHKPCRKLRFRLYEAASPSISRRARRRGDDDANQRSQESQQHGYHLQRDGAGIAFYQLPREEDGGGGDGGAVVYEAPCQGQHVRLVMDERGVIQHDGLMRLGPPNVKASRGSSISSSGGVETSGTAKHCALALRACAPFRFPLCLAGCFCCRCLAGLW